MGASSSKQVTVRPVHASAAVYQTPAMLKGQLRCACCCRYRALGHDCQSPAL